MASDKNQDGFSLTFLTEEADKGFAGRVFAGLFLYVGLFGCLWSVLGLNGTGANQLLIMGVGVLYCAVSCGLPKRGEAFYYAALIILAIYTIAISKFIIEGWNVTANQIFSTFENYFGRIFSRYEVSETANPVLCANLFLILPSLLLAALCGRTSTKGGFWQTIAFLPAIALWVAALVLRVDLPVVWTAVLASSVALVAGRRLTMKNRISDAGRMALWLLVLTIGLTVISSLPVIVVGDSGEKNADGARLAAGRRIHEMRYDEVRQTLPEGDFYKINAFADRMVEGFINKESQTDLVVTTTIPENYYLRSFVGEVYNGSGWTTLIPEKRAEYATLFSWLHERGFYAQNQYSLLVEALGHSDSESEIKIENIGACPAYLYAPYETVKDNPDKNRIGDENLPAKGLRGEEEYTLTVSRGSIMDYESWYGALSEAFNRGDADVNEYLESENAYREFVYETYLDIPDDAQATIEEFLVELYLPANNEVSFHDALTIVNAYLASINYTDLPSAPYEDGDFLAFFLQDSRQGNSIHFATASTMIFRYLGIPARYVEGYYLSESDISSAGAEGTVSLNGVNASAWTEVYRDGIGFVPFEPALLGEPLPEDQMPELLEDVPEEIVIPPLDMEKAIETLLRALIVVGILAAITVLVFEIRRAIKRSRLMKLLNASDHAEGISNMTTWTIFLLSKMSIIRKNGSLYRLKTDIEESMGSDVRSEYEAMIRVQQAVLFGGKPVTDEEFVRIQHFTKEMEKQLRTRSGSMQKLRLRWIECAL